MEVADTIKKMESKKYANLEKNLRSEQETSDWAMKLQRKSRRGRFKVLKKKGLMQMKKIKTKKFAPYWIECNRITSEYHKKMSILERKMRKDLGNDRLEFFRCDGDIVGIGTSDRKMKLINDTELDMIVHKTGKIKRCKT